jgi:hypothetical protein
MVYKKIWLGIPVMVLVFGLSVVGCDDSSTEDEVDTLLNGTWVATRVMSSGDAEVKYIFHNGNYEWFFSNTPTEKGTYKVNDNKFTFNRTHRYGDSIWYIANRLEKTIESKWYSREEIKEALSVDDEFLNNDLPYGEFVAEFSIADDKVTFVYESGFTEIYTRK